jgi:hypothetical protein
MDTNTGALSVRYPQTTVVALRSVLATAFDRRVATCLLRLREAGNAAAPRAA